MGQYEERMSVRIICDSASDISQEQAKEWNITVLPLKTIWGDREYLDGVTLHPAEFYEKLVETDELPTTSQLSPFDYEKAFKEVAEAGDTAVCLTLSSALSGSCQSARIAVEEYEDSIEIVDTMNVALGENILVKRAMKLREEGRSAKEIAAVLNEEKQQVKLIALVDTLEYLKRGGRVSATAAIAGAVLNIKPVIAIEDGKVAVLGKARGSKNGNNKLMELIRESGGINFEQPFVLGYAGLDDKLLLKYIEDSRSLYEGDTDNLPIVPIGSTIGTHTGPGAIGVAFFARK
jgi:DegV family protein with EDD domain